MISYLIVEDEPIAADKLAAILKLLRPEWALSSKLDSIKTTVNELAKNQPDLLFLDIHLADGNSFEIFKQVEVKCPVIFTTAYDQYAIQAFKQNSIDYLLKPIAKDDLIAAIEKYERINTASIPQDFKDLIHTLTPQKPKLQNRFMVFHGNKIKTIPVEEVAYFFSESKHCFLVHQSGEQFVIDGSLDKLEPNLDSNRFFRINRQFIISIEAISEMEPYSKSRVFVKLNPPSNKQSIVSVERSGRFKEWLNQ